jgi:CheY-like chemotaxis protein
VIGHDTADGPDLPDKAGKTATVLVVDDSDSKRYIMASWLRRAGYSVVEAATGQDALNIVERDPPNLAVLDVHLPDMSGLAVCARIKQSKASAGIPVLHVSAIAVDAADRSVGLDTGADAYLVDPIEPREFLSTVGALVRQSRRFAQEHQIALTLQRSLLPAEPPNLAGLRIAARYHASAAHGASPRAVTVAGVGLRPSGRPARSRLDDRREGVVSVAKTATSRRRQHGRGDHAGARGARRGRALQSGREGALGGGLVTGGRQVRCGLATTGASRSSSR